jgi:hypothetical protein
VFDSSLLCVEPLDKGGVVFGQVFVLRFGTTTFDTTTDAFEVLPRGYWQWRIDVSVPNRAHEENGGLVLPKEGVDDTVIIVRSERYVPINGFCKLVAAMRKSKAISGLLAYVRVLTTHFWFFYQMC